MGRSTNIIIFLLRISFGWLFLYAGITKVINPNWSAAFYLKDAQTFPALFNWFLNPEILPYVNFLNKWGLTLIGISLLVGIFVRWSTLAGILLMVLYYLPLLNFPKVGTHSYLIDEHIIYALALALLFSLRAGTVWGIDARLRRHY